MGIWNFISGTIDSLKRNAPEATAAKSLRSTAYGYGSATVTRIYNAVRDEESRSKIVLFGTSVVKHTAEEGLKRVPGYKILSKSLRDVKESDNQTSQKESDKEKVHLKVVQADPDGLKKEFSECRKLHKQEEIDKPCAGLKPADKIRSKM